MASQKFRVLVVDDDLFFRELLSRILTQRGYEVFSARTVMEAQRLLDGEIDLLFVDYRMPGIDGVTWIKQLRENGCILPIVFCSGSGCDASKLALLRNVLDVNLIITKPIDAQQLGLQLDELLTFVTRRKDNEQALVENARYEEQPHVPQYYQEDGLEWFVKKETALCKGLEETIDDTALINDSEDFFVDNNIESELASLAQEYLAQVPEILNQVRLGLIMAQVNQDSIHFESTINLVHQMRGTAGSLGFSRLSELASKLEDLLRSQNIENLALNVEITEEINKFLDSAMSVCCEYAGESINQTEVLQPLVQVVAKSSVEEQAQLFTLAPDEDLILEATVGEMEGRPGAFEFNCNRGLIIDQNALRVKDIVQTLKPDGWLIRTCFSCLEALSVIEEFSPEVLFIAVNMTSISGFDFCRMVRCNPLWQQLPIIMICEELAEREQAFSAGASELIFSPLVEEEIRRRTSSVCHSVLNAGMPLVSTQV
jgi:CheY-like chemotaxis protein